MARETFEALYSEIFPFWDRIAETEREYMPKLPGADLSQGDQYPRRQRMPGVILVRSGSLRLYILSEEGKDVTLYRLHRGTCMLSASCVFEAITFDVFIDAEEDSECYVISGPAFAAVSERRPLVKIFALETAVGRSGRYVGHAADPVYEYGQTPCRLFGR